MPNLSANYRRRAMARDPMGLIRLSSLDGGRLPALATPADAGVDLCLWAAGARDAVENLLAERKAILFRGFAGQSADQLDAFVAATSTGAPLEYVDRTTPRTGVGGGIYTSTVYPARYAIEQHSEGTYWRVWPCKIYFACAVAATRGGETPLTDNAAVLRRLPEEIRDAFAQRKFMLKRTFNKGFGLTWQEAFQTDRRSAVETYCADHEIEFEWRGDDVLLTRQVRAAIRRNPRTGEMVWFSHAAFYHASSYARELAAGLVEACGPDELPYETCFGDGAPIPTAWIEAIRAAIAAETSRFPWRAGDVLVADNMAVAHGRAPYEGERRVLVALTEARNDAA
jgi:alpha-ketoglutarate-dependent taurine dioxygenase